MTLHGARAAAAPSLVWDTISVHTMAEKCPLSPPETRVPEDSRTSRSPQEDGHGDGRSSAQRQVMLRARRHSTAGWAAESLAVGPPLRNHPPAQAGLEQPGLC